MSNFTIREDEWSFQITAAGSARFFVRVTSPRTSKISMIFSDFILNQDDDARAVEAIHLLKKHGFQLASPMKMVFQNIHPSYGSESDSTELVRRHDQIVAAVKNYAAQTGLKIENTLLEPNAGKFETVVMIE